MQASQERKNLRVSINVFFFNKCFTKFGKAEQRKERGRDSYLKSLGGATENVPLDQDHSISPVRYGMDHEHAIKVRREKEMQFHHHTTMRNLEVEFSEPVNRLHESTHRLVFLEATASCLL